MTAIRRLTPAREPEESKAAFARHLAHELKSYLANVRHSAELLADGVLGALTPKQGEVAQILRQNSLKLQWLTEYLLAFHSWTGAVRRAPLALDAALGRCLQRSRLLADARKVRLELKSPPDEVAIDGAALALLLDNVLSHAIKASPAGGTITVIGTLTGSAERGAVTLEVTDEGAEPLDAALLEAFDPDPIGARAPQPASRGGLAVAAAVAAAHGGRIEVGSARRGGCLRVRLAQGARDG